MSGYDIASRINVIDTATPAFKNIVIGMESVINNMEMMNANSKTMLDTTALKTGREAIEGLKSTLKTVENVTNQNKTSQDQHNNSIRQGSNGADGLLGKIKGVAAAYISFRAVAQGLKSAINLSDEMALTTARLNQINDGQQTTDQLNKDIYNSAMRSRGAYSQTADIVSKLGLQAGHAFSSNQETVAVAEQLQKRFKIAGTNAQGVESVMYNLTQAMSSGVLRGQDLNSVLANAPSIAQDMAEYMGYSVGEVKALAEEGKLTSDVLIQTMLSTAQKTDEEFANIPMTFSDMWTMAVNHIQVALQPVMEKINNLINTESFQQGASAIVNAVAWIAGIAAELFSIVIGIASFISENWTVIEPILWGVATALGAWLIATNLQTIATGFLIIKQAILNSTLLTNPIYAVIAIIVAVIVAIYNWVKSVGGIQMAWLLFKNAFWNVVASVQEAFFNMHIGIQKGMNTMELGIAKAVVAVQNWFTDMKVNVIKLAESMVNGVIDAINWLIDKVNKIPGVSIDAIESVEWATNAAVEAEAIKQSREAAVSAIQTGQSNEIKALENQLQAIKNDNAANKASREQEIAALEAKIAANKAETDGASNNIYNPEQYGQGYNGLTNGIADTAANTGKMAKDTSSINESLKRTNEELSYLKDLAVAKAINSFSIDKVDVRMENTYGDVNNGTDLDGYNEDLADKLIESVQIGIGGAINVY